MGLDTLKGLIPDYAKDIRLNLSSLSQDETLSTQRLWGTFVASAYATGNAQVLKAVLDDAQGHLSGAGLEAAKAAAAIMAMNNVYYRFVHLASNKEYQTMPAKLRMNIIANPGIEKADFELYSLAVSAINGCGMCIDAHEQQLIKEGVSKAEIQAAVRVASVVAAAASVLGAEQAMAAAGQDQAQAA